MKHMSEHPIFLPHSDICILAFPKEKNIPYSHTAHIQPHALPFIWLVLLYSLHHGKNIDYTTTLLKKCRLPIQSISKSLCIMFAKFGDCAPFVKIENHLTLLQKEFVGTGKNTFLGVGTAPAHAFRSLK